MPVQPQMPCQQQHPYSILSSWDLSHTTAGTNPELLPAKLLDQAPTPHKALSELGPLSIGLSLVVATWHLGQLLSVLQTLKSHEPTPVWQQNKKVALFKSCTITSSTYNQQHIMQ
eukprot:GHRR01026602.1.p1 GENE.GHRR01026602.1~~GHRR01026602.1.p1  ORF type:complete len:115 (+),score=24.14 GHRR01026602.1:432-776(+)